MKLITIAYFLTAGIVGGIIALLTADPPPPVEDTPGAKPAPVQAATKPVPPPEPPSFKLPASWEDCLGLAVSLLQNATQTAEDRWHSVQAISSCISEATTPDRLFALAVAAEHTLQLETQLPLLATQVAQQPTAVIKRLFLLWTSQASAEILFQNLPESLQTTLTQDSKFMATIFGGRAGERAFVQPPATPSPQSLARVVELMANHGHMRQIGSGAFANVQATPAFLAALRNLNEEDQNALVNYLQQNWAKFAWQSETLLYALGVTIPVGKLDGIFREAAQHYSSDLVLMEYGRAFARPKLEFDLLLKTLNEFPSELSKAELIKGFNHRATGLSDAQVQALEDAIDVPMMKRAIREAAAKSRQIKEEPGK